MEVAPRAFSDGLRTSLGNTFSLLVGVGSRVLTQNKSQNRGPDLLKVWARAINAISNMGVPTLPKHPPEAANWHLLTAPAGKSPPGPARRTRCPKCLPASMAGGPTVWGRTGPPPVGQAAQLKGGCAAADIQASWQRRPFRNPIFSTHTAAAVSSSLQGADTWRGWGLRGTCADGFGLHRDQLVQEDSGEKKGSGMDSLFDSLAIARIE